MADFSLEQLKTVLDNMVDSLDETTGDEGTHEELEQIKKLLQDLYKQISKDAKGSDKENKDHIKAFFDEWDRRNPLKDLRRAVDDLDKKAGDNPLRIAGGGKGNKSDDGDDKPKGSGNPLRDGADMARKGHKFAKVLGSATAVMSAIATGGGEIVNFLKQNASAYRSVIQSAEGSITSIMDMRDTAAKNNMTVDQLVTASSHEGVRMEGLKTFASFQNSVRNFAKANGDFGMTVQQLQDATADYADMSKSLGVLNSENKDEAAKGIGKLIVVNQDMAAMMGKTAEQARQAALEQSRDPQFNAAMRAAQLNPEVMKQMDEVIGNLPDATKNLVKELYSGHGTPLTAENQTAVAMSPAAQRLAQEMARARDKGSNLTGDEIQRIIRQYATDAQSEAKRQGNQQDIAALQAARGEGKFNAYLRSQDEMLQVDPKKFGALQTNGGINGADDATKAALKVDEIQSRLSAGLDDILNSAIRPAFKEFGGTMNKAADEALAATQKLHDVASWLDKHPNTAMAGGGATGLLALGGEAAASMWAMSKLWKGGKKLLGRGGGAVAEGTEAVEGAEAAGVAGEAGAAGLGAVALPAAAIAGGALGMYSGYQNLATGKKDWWTRLKGYGEAGLGGAAVGGGVGALAGGVGAIPGALIGGLLGIGTAAYSDWSHPDSANAVGGQRIGMPGGVAATNRPAVNASNHPGSALANIVQLDTKMLEMQHAIHFTLNDIKKASYDQLNTMREELAHHRAANAQIARLLEESNKNTKQISALT
jgi:polyhydroxyalkanoate synthesis regulator phasin